VLHLAPDVLLYTGFVVWVMRTGFPAPTRRTEGGFRVSAWDAAL